MNDSVQSENESILKNFSKNRNFRGNRNVKGSRGKGALVTKAQMRKAARKQSRKDKKAGKHQFLLAKCEKTKKNPSTQAPQGKTSGKHGKKDGQLNASLQTKSVKPKSKVAVSGNTKKGISLGNSVSLLREEEANLKKDMEDVRRKRLIEDNAEEDRYINQLQKKLKLNKKAIIPASFRTDGLDYLLEICDNKKSPKQKKPLDRGDEVEEESDYSEENDDGSDLSELEDDPPKKSSKSNQDKDKRSRQHKAVEESDEFSNDEMESNLSDFDSDDNSEGESLSDSEDTSSDAANKEMEEESSIKQKLPKEDQFWEDIYGRLRDKSGAVIDSKAAKTENKSPTNAQISKYVPPMKRTCNFKRDSILKSLKGLLNRLSEGNMHRISQQVEELYMTNSRNEMNGSMLELFRNSLVQSVSLSERIILEHMMLVTILHANVGTEVGAFFIQNFVEIFRLKYDETENLEDSKELQNLVLLISFTYHFRIVNCCLIYDILDFLAEKFTAKDVELILTILKSVGFRLRKDDPAALKTLVLLLQQKATLAKLDVISSRVKFMLEILMAIRNNNMNKIPNYDPSFGEHLLKILKVHISKGNYVSELKISMKDLLNAETKGRWWIVGSAWNNEEVKEAEEDGAQKIEKEMFNQKLLLKAKSQGMNTEIRQNIFCVLMTAEDYLDAFEKLCRLGLKNQMEREIIFVVVYCCLQENKFNPYYSLIATKFCSVDRKHMYSSKFKLEAIEYAKLIGQRATSRFLEVSQRRIFDWISCWQKIVEEVDPSNPTKISDFGTILQFVTPTATIPEKDNLTNKSAVISNERRSTRVKKAAATFIPSNETEINESDLPQSDVNISTTEAIEIDQPVESKDKCVNGSNISSRSSKQVLDFGVESDVFTWVQSLLPSKATSSQIRNKARELYREKGYTKIQCSYGWYRRWAERFRLSSDPHGDTDPAILVWLLQQYDNNIQVSYADLQKYAQTVVTKYKPNFKASVGWAMRFFKRHHLFINWEGIYEDSLPPVLQDKVEEYILRLRTIVIPGFPPNRIGCLDEIPLSFSATGCNTNNRSTQQLSLFPPASNSDDDVCELKMPRARKITVKNCDATVILAMLADGNLLPPLVIIKDDKKNLINRAFVLNDKPIVVFYNETTEPTPIALKKWMDTVWIPNVSYGPPSILLCDSYDNHHLVSKQFETLSVRMEIFPEGTACKLQPLGVFAKVAFLKSMEEYWLNYLKESCSGPNVKLPSTSEVINWIHETYCKMKLNYDRLKDSFRMVGLTDGTETELTG